MTYYPLAEIIINIPNDVRSNYEWIVYLPDISGQPELLSGTGYDYEDCWDQAVKAREYLKRYGLRGDRPL